MMRRLIALCCLLLHLGIAPLAAQTETEAEADVIASPSANDLAEFTRLLSDPRIQNWISDQAEQSEVAQIVPSLSLSEEVMRAVNHTRVRIGDLASALRALPQVVPTFVDRWRAALSAPQQVRGLTFVVIFLFVGAGLEWLYRQYTDPLKLRVELSRVETIRARVTAGALRALITIGGLAIFALGSIGAFAAFNWPPLMETLVLNLLVVIFAVRTIRTLLVLFLAPRVQELRLLPFKNRLAKHLARVVLGLTGLYVLSISLADIYARLTGATEQTPQALAAVVLLATLCLLVTYAVIIYSFRRVAVLNTQPMTRATRLWRVYLIVLTTLAFMTLLLDRTSVMWTLVLLGLLVPCLILLRAWVDGAFDRARVDTNVGPALESGTDAAATHLSAIHEPTHIPTQPHPYESYRPLAQRVVRFIAIFVVGLGIALIWDLQIFQRAAASTFTSRLMQVVIDSAVALLIADLIWVWARSAIDRRLDAYVPPEPGTAPGPEARMATLLPLLRVTLMVALLAMVSVSILASIGVNIAPILAGAGVLGIAIGFGAQSLVKDVVSGIFFLVDDAFRVGEYVEIDQLRGTVERISIRSLQLRHHRGAVHTLPYGELRHLTNHSRDWVIMKLEFRVPFDTDLKLVKKLVKEIGERLKANEEYGPHILETLKSQGVRRMEEFNMVVGVKFMTRPGEQWLVRRDAYMMVRDAFEANGIRMAERNVKVEVTDPQNLAPAERAAVAGAAQQAVEGGVGLPKAGPDQR